MKTANKIDKAESQPVGEQAQPTPTPWTIDDFGVLKSSIAGHDSFGIGEIYDAPTRNNNPEQIANAAFVLAAVNAYASNQKRIEVLTEAVKFAVKYHLMLQTKGEKAFPRQLIESLEAALATIEEGK